MVKQITDVDIRRAAMDLLARREHGATELKQKLKKRFDKVSRALPENSMRGEACVESAPNPEALSPEVLSPEVLSPEVLSPEVLSPEVLSPKVSLTLEERIEAAIQQLTEEGLQSDERLAEAFIRARANRGQGPVKIKAELRQKGINDRIVSDAMAEADQDWYQLAAEVASKKFRDPVTEPKDRAKRSRFLQQRGFSFDQIASIEEF